MSNSLVLGIDLGTSAVKVVFVDAGGQVAAGGAAEYPILHPAPERAEQEPAAWWQAVISAARAALAALDRRPDVAAIGLSGQMHGAVLLDAGGQVLTPAIIWPDQRSGDQVREITALIGAEHLIELTGSPVATGFQAASVCWVQEQTPEVWQRTRQLLLPKDYLRWRLTGEFATDPSDGSGALLLDVHRRDWSDELLSALRIDRALLPPVLGSQTVAGRLTAAAAAELGLSAGIPVVTGAADTACSALAAGAVGQGTLLLTISSGGQLVLPFEQVAVDRRGRIHTFCSALEPGGGRAAWYQMGAILSAGMALRWLRDQVFALQGQDAYAQMTSWAEEARLGADGLIFLPYLAGERTPHMDPHARGLLLGLTLQHGRPEIVRAVMEGVTLALVDAYSVLVQLGAAPDRIVLAGGGGRSLLWRQMVADAFGLPVQPLEAAEQSAVGAALLAAAGAGWLDPVEAAPRWASVGASIPPDAARHRRYQELLAAFRQAYERYGANR